MSEPRVLRMPEGRRYHIETDTFSGPLVTVEVDGVVIQIQAARGVNKDGAWIEEAREAIRKQRQS